MALSLPFGEQLVAQTPIDDYFMFLQASKRNIERSMQVWDQFALDLGLHINWRKSRLICYMQSDLGWQGLVIT